MWKTFQRLRKLSEDPECVADVAVEGSFRELDVLVLIWKPVTRTSGFRSV